MTFDARGFVAWRGPSAFDGSPIVVVITLESLNEKTGPMAQAWVLRADIDPQAAIADGRDASICGDCIHRSGGRTGRSCYVITWFGPLKVYRSFREHQYPTVSPEAGAKLLQGEQLRITAYGDPAAVPFDVWRELTRRVSGWTGYTQQWRACEPRFRELLMASVSSAEEAEEAHAAGWRSYRARLADEPLAGNEIICPASNEADHRLTCAECNLCRGHALAGAKSIAIIVHGQRTSWFESRKRAAVAAAARLARTSA